MHPQNVVAYYEADAQVEAAQADFEKGQQELILRVAQAYFDAPINNYSLGSVRTPIVAGLQSTMLTFAGVLTEADIETVNGMLER